MTEKQDIEIARDFLNFMVDYYSLTRRHIIETNQYRFHSHGFSMLYTLRKYRDQPVTMTKFAQEMGITKQQLTKLVNDLEEQNYVCRSHNKDNRRQVYISITDEGLAHLERMLGELLHEIVRSLARFSEEERLSISEHATALSELFRRDAEAFREGDASMDSDAE
ncbi:MAG: MarR family transcriptional regulator [Clostridia bacterium]|nr:MarR family transcriptional regulator [Clostridia bacterium]